MSIRFASSPARAQMLGAFFCAIGVLSQSAALAQQPTVNIQLRVDPPVVAVGQSFTLTAVVEVDGGQAERVDLPDFSRFNVLSRRVEHPINFTVTGGRPTINSTTRHVITLESVAPGVHTFDAIRATVGGVVHTGQPTQIDVRGNAADAQAAAQEAMQAAEQRALGDGAVAYRVEPQAFLRTRISNARPYVGQQVTITLELCARTRVGQLDFQRGLTAEGFWVQEFSNQNNRLRGQNQTIEGVPHEVYELRSFAAFPLDAGELSIDGGSVNIGSGGGLFARSQPNLIREAAPLTVEVQALPEARSNVVVGPFSLSATLDPPALETGQASTLTMRADGTGNLRDLSFELPELEGVRVMAPEIDQQTSEAGNRLRSTRTISWLLIPDEPGTYALPSFVVSSFDPSSGQFERVSTNAMTLTVTGESRTVAATRSQLEDTSPIADSTAPTLEVHAISQESELRRDYSPLSSQPWFLGSLVAPPALFLAVLLIGAARNRSPNEEALNKKARSEERRALAEAVTSGDAAEFYRKAENALRGAVDGVLGEASAGMTLGALRGKLGQQMDASVVKDVVAYFEEIDRARFAGSDNDLSDAHSRLLALLTQVEGSAS